MVNSCTFYGYMDPINFKKPLGFLNSLKKKNIHIDHMNQGNFGCSKNNTDLFFGECHDLTCDFSKNKFVIFWDNIELKKIKQIANFYKKTIFLIATKSWIFDENINKTFCKKYDSKYAYFGRENIYLDINEINNELKNTLLDSKLDLYKISKNLYLTYLPCCLSEDEPNFNNFRQYDIIYVGSVHNRPIIKKTIDFLKTKYNVFSTYDKKIGPLEAISMYSNTKVAIHEQVAPVLLEHPVRLGETRRQGCSFISFSEFVLPNNIELVPDYTECYNYDVFIEEIEKNIKNYKNNPYILNTYDLAIDKLFKIIERMQNEHH